MSVYTSQDKLLDNIRTNINSVLSDMREFLDSEGTEYNKEFIQDMCKCYIDICDVKYKIGR